MMQENYKPPISSTVRDVALIMMVLSITFCIVVITFQFVQVSNKTEEAITRLTRDTTLMERSFRDMAEAMKNTYAKDAELREKILGVLVAAEGSFNEVSAGFRTMSNAVENSLAAIPPAARTVATRLDEFGRQCGVVLDGVGGEIRGLLADTRGELIPRVCDTIDTTNVALGEVAPTITATRESVEKIGNRIDNELQGIAPLLEAITMLVRSGNDIAVQGEKIVAQGAEIAEHYKKMILHPSVSQRIKGWLQLFFSGMTVFANSKILF